MKTPSILAGTSRGFTLIEAVVAIVITGIAGAMVALFARGPIQSYMDVAQRAELTDAADTALRRMSRDIRLALPNSVRITGSGRVLEFLQTRTGGRYRAATANDGSGDPLDFRNADTSFDVIGPGVTMSAGDQIVIYNLGVPGADAYEGNAGATHNRRAYNGSIGTVNNVVITSGDFPFDSPGHRFQVVDTPVTYKCDLVARTLTRYWGYPITAAQSADPGGSSARLADNVTDCEFNYEAGITQRSGLVSMHITLEKNNETVTLYHEVHVNNVP
ncbi:type II secretion system protein [Noviherbaspirillum agri]